MPLSVYFLIRLIASGYSAEEAGRFAAQVLARANADPAQLDVFAHMPLPDLGVFDRKLTCPYLVI